MDSYISLDDLFLIFRQSSCVCRGSAIMDFRLFNDRSMIVAGPSQSGKTTFLLKLMSLKNELFMKPIHRVLWAYGQYQPLFHSSLKSKGIILQAGIPQVSDLRPHDLVILDDLLGPSESNSEMTTMFTQTAHHLPCFIIFVTQNIFPRGKEARTRSLNTHYFVLFKNPRDRSQIQILARQMYPRRSNIITDIYEDATKEPHGYLFIDLTQECPEGYRIRSGIFNDPMYLYQF